MAQIRKMDCQVEIKSSAEQFFDAFKNKMQLMPKLASQVISDVKLVQGDWNSVGCVRKWTYILGGAKIESGEEQLEAIDDESKTLTFKMAGGEIGNTFKSLKSVLKVTPKDEGSLVNWTLIYEKQNDNSPEPVGYKDFMATWIKNVDANLSKA
ncbi:hypothetical protein COLO4_13145 [Corchorus olitorius]|uniref:Bet v I/Major latex protein domain-containing protein n=1 Tax=Corchorus olitorius TaxID=93759 RepID=A0A1R3JY10_9ROSI|nr:hypothetical protein COLO4_13145 [Corchorus olitorius]